MSELTTAYKSDLFSVNAGPAEKLVRAYAHFRKAHIARPPHDWNESNVWTRADSAVRALKLARDDVAKGKPRYNSTRIWSKPITNPLTERRTRWIEKPSAMGLRFVGYADDLAKIDHTGWHTDIDGHDSIRGVVYQLPGRDGKARFVAGHDNADNGKADSDGPAYLDFSQIIESDFESEMRSALASIGRTYQRSEMHKPGYWAEAAHETARREAARAADEFTRVQAEQEREYNTAWQAGNLWSDTVDEIQQERESVKALLGERKAVRHDPAAYPAICATIRSAIESSLETIQELRDKRDKLASGDYHERDYYLGFYPSPELRAAFNDGAGKAVL